MLDIILMHISCYVFFANDLLQLILYLFHTMETMSDKVT